MTTTWTLVLALAAQAKADPSEAWTLENGLTVIVRPLAGAKKTAVLVLFNLGGDHDPRGKSGLAHFVEHLYVTSAAGEEKARTVEEIFKRYPDGHNAQTGERYTLVASVVPQESLEAELRDAAARMGALKIEPADLDRERPRLLSEVDNMFGRIPELGVRNRATELIRPTPLGGRREGRPEHLASITTDDVRNHWKKYYKPRNALLVVAGGDARKTRAQIEKLFAGLPAGEPLPEPATPTARRSAPVDIAEAKPLIPQSPSYAGLAYAVPAPTSDLYAAYLVLASRLTNQGTKVGSEPGHFPVAFAPLDDPSRISIAVPLKPGESGDQAIQRLEAFVEESVRGDLKEGEAQTVLQSFGFILGLTDAPEAMLAMNPYGVAIVTGRSRQMGLEPAKLKESLKGLKNDDLKRVVRELFAPDRRGAAVVVVKD